MIQVCEFPFDEWKERPTNRLYGTLLGSNPSDNSRMVTLVPCEYPKKLVAKSICADAKIEIDGSTELKFISFTDTHQIMALYRGTMIFSLAGGFGPAVLKENRQFNGVYIVLITCFEKEELSKGQDDHRRFISALRLSKKGALRLGAIEGEFSVSPESRGFGIPSISSEFSVVHATSDLAEPIPQNARSLSAQTVEALEAAQTAPTERIKFVFLWIALEAFLGNANERTSFIKLMDSVTITDEFKRLRSVRASILKSDENEPQRGYDTTFLVMILEARAIDDPVELEQHVRRIEEMLRHRMEQA